jgi:hypothetical protein
VSWRAPRPAGTAWTDPKDATIHDVPPVPARPAVDAAKIADAVRRIRAGGASVGLMLNGAAMRAGPLDLAGRIKAATGCRIFAPTSNGRTERGAGRFAVERVPYVVDMALETLKDVRTLILVGARAPVAFFAYPGKPSVVTPPDCEIVPLADLHEDLTGTLEALVEATPLVGLDFLAATPSAMTGWSGTRGGAGTGEATVFNAAGDLAIAAGSEWRIAHDPATLARLGLLVEPARTNGVRNPRAEGAVAGNPGTAPTNWAIGGANGIAAQIVGTGTENGMPYVAVRFTGTVPSGTGSGYVWFEGSNAIAGVNGDSFANAYFA